MPITPLHFGALAPVNHWFPGKVSLVSFTLANLAMDWNAIQYYLFGLEPPLELHSPFTHSLLAAVIFATILSVLPLKWIGKWVCGAFLGTVSHVVLDALVHSEMQPFYPIHWNPLYAGLMEPLTWILLPLMIWFIVQTVSSCSDWVRKRQEARQAPLES
ncbi:metal-dependent hydrolase [Marinobacter sp. MMG032]|uniref:Metal-dependent hydrolase n=1 Tax=Marinobacter sp. MMG032 TaxID=3158548 RepID=A0AAU7MPE2_9GAMM